MLFNNAISIPRHCTIVAVVLLLSMFSWPDGVVAQPKRMAGLFFGSDEAELHVTLHGLLDTTVRKSVHSFGAVYEIPLSGDVTLAFMPQISEVIDLSGGLYSGLGQAPNRQRIQVWMPKVYALELPASLRAGTRWKNLNPYVSAGVFLGYTFRSEVEYYLVDFPDRHEQRDLDLLLFIPFSRFYMGVQLGAGIRLDIFRNVSLWGDWTLMKHLAAPVDSDLLTVEAPLRGLWHIGVLFTLDGGDK
ncbi:MAG: hypothetical protein KFH87_02710 [Bacteroidetes bacterium]|nr:hypothetical protein [Bacteroidota bacterium]